MSITFRAQANGLPVDSRFVPFTFPGGERHFKDSGSGAEQNEHCIIRGADANDYVAAKMWAEMVHAAGGVATAYIPYLPAARADRGLPFGAKAYAGLINDIGADHVICFDPHSPVMPALIHNLQVIDSARLVRRAVGGYDTTYTGIIAPDKGAAERAGHAAHALHLPLYTATKDRVEATGALSNFQCPDLPADGKYLVVDDIADGGGTFRGLAAATGLPREQLGLFVSHGIFSGAAADLNKSYGEIITTDSHPGAHNSDVAARVIPVVPYMIGTN